VRLGKQRRASNNVRLPRGRDIEARVRAQNRKALPKQINGIECGENVCKMNVGLSEKMANLDENDMIC
jgi:hypothetical protein